MMWEREVLTESKKGAQQTIPGPAVFFFYHITRNLIRILIQGVLRTLVLVI